MKRDFPIKMLLFGKRTDLTINAFCLQSNHSHNLLHLCQNTYANPSAQVSLFSLAWCPRHSNICGTGALQHCQDMCPSLTPVLIVPGSLMERGGVGWGGSTHGSDKASQSGGLCCTSWAPESIPHPSRERSWRAIV